MSRISRRIASILQFKKKLFFSQALRFYKEFQVFETFSPGKNVHLVKMSSQHNWTLKIVYLFSFLFCAQLAISSTTPEPPKLQFLYTAFVECESNLMAETAGPHGIRKAIPIVGGNFTGPHISGKSLSFLPSHPYIILNETKLILNT